MDDLIDFVLFLLLLVNLLKVILHQLEHLGLHVVELIDADLAVENTLESEKG